MNQLFIDTANLNEIIEANEMGVVSGVTTNPSIVSKEPKGDYDKLVISLAKYCGDNNLSFSIEVFASEYLEIISQAKELHEKLKKYSNNIYIKVPIGKQELKAINVLSSLGIKVNCTCCYTKEQMDLATLAGAKYVSLFYARLRDIGGNPNEVLNHSNKFIHNSGTSTKIIAGSIRTAGDVVDSWQNGAHIVTTGLSVIQSMASHPQTNSSVNKFLEDFKSWRS